MQNKFLIVKKYYKTKLEDKKQTRRKYLEQVTKRNIIYNI